MPLPAPPEWTPGPDALEYAASLPPDDDAPAALVVHHPGTPFVHHFDVGADAPAQLQASALEYLAAFFARFPAHVPDRWHNLLRRWLAALRAADDAHFGWMRVPDGDTPAGPATSVRADATVVLIAGERLGAGDAPQGFIGSEFGLGVTGHLRTVAGAPDYRMLAITGFSASLPFGAWRDRSLVLEPGKVVPLEEFGQSLARRSADVAAMLGLYADAWFSGLRLHRLGSGELRFEARGTGYDIGADGGRGPTPYAFVAAGIATDAGEVRLIEPLERRPAVAFNVAHRRAFAADPMSHGRPPADRSRRPSRDDTALGAYLRQRIVPPSAHLDVRAGAPVRPGFLAVPAAGAVPAIHSDAFGQENTAVHLDAVLNRITGWGVAIKPYFACARLPVRVLTRSGIRPGPGKDGQTVNARVAQGDVKASFFQTVAPAQKAELTMCFAAGTLASRSRRPPVAGGLAPAEYLGVGTDPRWVWHEVGHVLLAAAVGELEFRFAHSAGDALGAIALDPTSRLEGRARGATFPWVFIPRRHDRSATQGWSWSGALHGRSTQRAVPHRPRFRGYASEQILSSTLFRLYRALGGDAVRADGSPDRAAREAAADYALYLIVRAIQLLGPAHAKPAHLPEAFAAALANADIGRPAFTTTVPDGNQSRTFTRAGGAAHKMIRWAFEAQGLYAPPGRFVNGPGDPPAVDLYIADDRATVDASGGESVDFGAGSYVPVSLEWTPGAGPAPWHATQAITVAGTRVTVEVGNRGTQTAHGVRVQAWVRDAAAGLPAWEGGIGWTRCQAASGATVPTSIAAGASAQYGAFDLPAGQQAPFALLAIASCPADVANAANGALPCATAATRLADLVAGDNNLGLRYIA